MADDRRVIVTTMKNEGPFILDWVAYNLVIGFTDFLIFTNDCADGTDAIAERLGEMGFGAHVDNNARRGKLSPQRSALRLGPRHEIFQASRWAICADVDEYVNVRVGEGRLDDLFEAVGDVDAVSMTWRLFGNGGRRHYEDQPVIEQFFWAAPEARYTDYRGAGLKTLFRNNGRFNFMGVHRPKVVKRGEVVDPEAHIAEARWVDGGGRRLDPLKIGWKASGEYRHDLVRMHHYAVRSADSFLVKRDRGRTNHVNMDQGMDYWRGMNANFVQDFSILRHAEAAREKARELRSDRVLDRLHRRACAWHRAKIEELKAREDWGQFVEAVYEANPV